MASAAGRTVRNTVVKVDRRGCVFQQGHFAAQEVCKTVEAGKYLTCELHRVFPNGTPDDHWLVSGIIYMVLLLLCRSSNLTQWKRAGLITLKSLDRN